MKKLFFILPLICAITTYSQVVLEHTYHNSGDFSIIAKSSGSDFYVFSDQAMENANGTETETVTYQFYNSNHSLYKTMQYENTATIPSTSGTYISNRIVILDHTFSDNLFNTDTKIEFLAIVNESNMTNGNGYVRYIIQIMDEDFNVVQRVDTVETSWNAGVPTGEDYQRTEIIKMDNRHKLVISGEDITNNTVRTSIYDVPGTIVSTFLRQSLDSYDTNVYPNPSSSSARISYDLGEETEGTINIYDLHGSFKKSYQVTNRFNDVIIDNSELPAGSYLYQIKTARKTTESKKMIVVK